MSDPAATFHPVTKPHVATGTTPPTFAGFDPLAEIAEHSAGLARAAEANLDAPVEHCPGWTVADLVWHLSDVHWFWAKIVAELPSERPEDLQRPERAAPVEPRMDDPAARLERNKTNVVAFYDLMFNEARPAEAIERYAGDVYVHVHVKPDARFVREGDDVFSTVDLTMTQAALGATVTIETLDGTAELEFAPGTQPGETRVLEWRTRRVRADEPWVAVVVDDAGRRGEAFGW